MAEGKKVLVITGVAAAVCLGMKYLLPYAAPFVMAVLFVRLMNPLLIRVRKRTGWRKEILAAVLITLLTLAAAGGLYLFYERLMDELCRIIADFDQYARDINGFLDDCCCMLEKKVGADTGEIRGAIDNGLSSVRLQLQEKAVPGVLNHSFQYLVKMIKAAGFFFVLFIGIILLAKDYDKICSRLEQYQLYLHARSILNRIWQMGGAYLKAQFLILGIIMLLCVVGLYLLQNPYALLLGIVIGLLDALPFLGTGTVLIPWAVILLIQKKFVLAAGYGVLFLVTNTIRELLEPKLFGEKTGIYPFAVAAAVYAGLYYFGGWGVLLGPLSLLLILEICRDIFSKSE